MRRHTKALSAGLTSGRASRLCSFLRGAFAARAASSDSSGSSAPSKRRSLALFGALVLTTVVALGAVSALADTPPSVTIDDPSAVNYNSAHLSGTVNPQGGPSATSWHFEYTTTPGEKETWNPFGGEEFSGTQAEETSPIPVVADLGALTPGTEYFVRLVATNGEGENRAVTALKSFTTDPVNSPTATIGAITAITGTSAHFSGTVNSGGPKAPEQDTTYSFQCSPECPGLSDGSVPTDGSDHAVEEDATNLASFTEYTVTLTATNAGGKATEQSTFTTGAPIPLGIAPDVEPWNTWATPTKILVSGRINPHNAPTTYHFEYGDQGPCSANPCTALPEEAAINDNQLHIVSRVVTGLDPNKTYSFRLIAEGEGTTAGPDSVVSTEGNGRAYEMVSPIDKNGGNIASNPVQTRAAADGNGVMFTSTAAFGEGAGAYILSNYLAKRGSHGWDTHGITPRQQSPTTFLPDPENQSKWVGDFSDDLSAGIFYSATPIDDRNPNVAGLSNMYLGEGLTDSPGVFSLISNAAVSVPTPPGVGQREFLAGATPDFGHIIFETALNLTPDASGEYPQDIKLYEWDHGTLRLAGMLPGGAPADVSFAGSGAYNGFYTPNMISNDGSRVFFAANPLEASNGHWSIAADLYMREDHATSTKINVSERSSADPLGPQPAELWSATPDGSKVYFTTREEMTDDDSNTGKDLYMYEPDKPTGERLTLISVDNEPGGSGTTNDRVSDMLGVSADGEYVYFVGDNSLVAGQPGSAPPGKETMYIWHNGTVKPVADSANELGLDRAILSGRYLKLIYSVGLGHDVRVSSTGAIAFATSGPNLGYDNVSRTNPCYASGGLYYQCDEVYVYQPTNGELKCASCNPTGAPPTGNTSFTLGTDFLGGIGAAPNQYESTAVLDDGSKVFFSSPNPLVSQDTNGKYDAYEYDTATGKVALLSTGQCECDSLFVDASQDGRDVFFTTTQQLVRIDTDNLRDLYDARVGGGIAAQNEPPPALCEGDACQSPVLPPNDSTPASMTYSGPGSPAPKAPKARRCRRGRAHPSGARRAQRCAKQGRQKATRHGH